MNATNESYLEHELELLVQDYFDSPAFAQRNSLQRINAIRANLGKNPVDSLLRETDAKTGKPLPKPKKQPKPANLEEMHTLYDNYLAKKRLYEVHQRYAEQVAKATHGSGMTPVKPLATMGCNGGALLCDHCGKPMILEGGNFNRVPVDVAWAKQSPTLRINWVSWISGGMVVEIAPNGTLRIYHGHLGNHANECSAKAAKQMEQEEQKANASETKRRMCKSVTEYVAYVFPELSQNERTTLVNDILNTMYNYDPGIGINRPDMESSLGEMV